MKTSILFIINLLGLVNIGIMKFDNTYNNSKIKTVYITNNVEKDNDKIENDITVHKDKKPIDNKYSDNYYGEKHSERSSINPHISLNQKVEVVINSKMEKLFDVSTLVWCNKNISYSSYKYNVKIEDLDRVKKSELAKGKEAKRLIENK